MSPARRTTAVLALALLAAGAPGRARVALAAPAGARPAVVPPKLVTFVEATFPESELAAEKGAVVTLQISISETGAVAAVEVVGSAGAAFDAAAVEAARRFVFEPATSGGKAIPVRITYRYEFTWTPTLIKKTTAELMGTVRERVGKRPVAAVKVALDTGAFAVTDEAGRFAFPEVAPGVHTVTLSGDRMTSVATSETLEAGQRLDATYEIERAKDKGAGPREDEDDLEIVVTAARLDKQVVATEVAAEQGKKIPGTQGDVLKVVEDLPGVARSAVGSGTLVVWGAAPADTRVYVDGVRVPRLYHDGGYRSIMQSDMVRSVELIPGGYGPTYGRGLGGIVSVQLARLDEKGFHGSASADTLDAGASVRDDLTDRLHVQLGGRKSYLDSVVSAVTSQNLGQVVPIPQYYDGQARLVYDLGPHETLEVGGLLSSDTTRTAVTSLDPALASSQTTGLTFGRLYARYEKHGEDGATVAVVPSWGRDSSSLTSVFGSVPTDQRNDSDAFGLRAWWRGALTKYLGATIGLDAEVVSSSLERRGSLASPAREGDVYVFGQAPSGQLDADAWKAVVASVAPYAELDVAPFGDLLHVVPGVRFEPYFTSASRLVPQVGSIPSVGFSQEVTAVDPRVSVRYAPHRRVLLKAAVGLYHQPPAGEDLSAVFGTPKLGLSQAQHYVAGGRVTITDTLDVEVTGFLSQSSDLPTRSPAPAPYLANALVQEGTGRSFGAQVLLRQQKIGRFFGWLSYTLMRAERQDHPTSPVRLFDYDQTHVLTALGSYDLEAEAEVGVRFRYATGFPRTPVRGAYYDATTDAYQPKFGAQNSVRIPEFYALDVRVAKRLKVGTTEGEIYLDVQNVTNHANAEELVYDPTYSQRGTITGLPVLPVVGARWSW